ncbi:MAG: acyl carrier protein [Spartobacteria bacterium]|nr:acyl carrier protein [Spartobacteria bacterium]
MSEIRQELKKYLIEHLSLEDIEPEDIKDDEPLFDEGLALDSLDAVEIVVILQRYYGISVKDADMGREVFETINTLTEYIYNHTSESI